MARPKDFILDSEVNSLRRAGNHNAAQILVDLRKDNARLQMLADSMTTRADNAETELKAYKAETDAAFRRNEELRKGVEKRMARAVKLLSEGM